MIRIHVTLDAHDEHVVDNLQIIGHAGDKQCNAVSVVFLTALLGLRWLAKKYPKDIVIFEREVKRRA